MRSIILRIDLVSMGDKCNKQCNLVLQINTCLYEVNDIFSSSIIQSGYSLFGIGFDFDGGTGIARINGANDMINITIVLLQRGYNEDDIEKIWGKNFFRVLDQVQAAYDSQRSNRIKSSKIQKAHQLSY